MQRRIQLLSFYKKERLLTIKIMSWYNRAESFIFRFGVQATESNSKFMLFKHVFCVL